MPQRNQSITHLRPINRPLKIDCCTGTSYNKLFSVFMFIRTYLRASTKEQDTKPARNELIHFANDHGHKIAGFDVENESGATLIRP